MINIKKKKAEEFKIDVSALVDVLFTLLIFFSLTSTFVSETGISVDLPSASSGGSIVNHKKLYVSIDKSGGIALNDIEVSMENLKKELSKIDNISRKKYLLVLKADLAVSHGKVTEVLDLIKTEGFENIAIATRSSE